MKINEIISFLESIAPPSLQEHYDNAGLITGDADWECTGIICSLDAIEDVVKEAIEKKCNLIVAHHPIIFSGLKKINGKNYVEKTIIRAIKNDIAIYAIHTNLDNVADGVSGFMAAKLGLQNISILAPKNNTLKKLFTFVPVANAPAVRESIFAAGGGHIGNYSECSFNAEGTGTFRAGEGTTPFVGEIGNQHHQQELKIEVIIPAWLSARVVSAMKAAHPYEEVAWDLVPLDNTHSKVGAGVIGELPSPLSEPDFLSLLKKAFHVPVVRYTKSGSRPVQRVALCGGAGSFMISNALAAGADAYVTADVKYHEFFDANDRLLLADIGHYESEQFTVDLLQAVLAEKFLNFAVLKTGVKTNPVNYF